MTFRAEHTLETYRSLVTVSMEGLKAVLLINGGAIVALLAFLGQSTLGPQLGEHIQWPMVWFVVGLSCAAVAFLLSYLTQLSLYNEHFTGKRAHRRFLVTGLILFMLSVGAFSVGAFAGIQAFTKVDEQKPNETKADLNQPAGHKGTLDVSTFTLYRTSVVGEGLRIHVATFNAVDGEAYNAGNCDQAQKLFQAQPGVKTKFWCEKGTFSK